MEAGRLQDFDYGAEGNRERYGTEEVPVVDLTLISGIPVALFVADRDTFASLEDSRWLREEVEAVRVFYKEYHGSHTSF